jgi:hypothetical protein
MADVEERILAALQDTRNVLAALRVTLTDVGERVSRLQEWVELELYVLKLASSFEKFNGEVRRVPADGSPESMMKAANAWPLITNLWETCRNEGLMDLEICVENLGHLTRPLANDPASDLRLVEWVGDLNGKGAKISEAIAGPALKDLKDQCDQFDDSVKRKIGLHRQRMKKEIAVLAEVSVQLRTRLDVTVSS